MSVVRLAFLAAAFCLPSDGWVVPVDRASAAAGVPAQPSGDAGLMPGEAAVPGWKKNGTPRVFTSADLYGYIDGGAELFFEFGFDQLTLQKYRNGAQEIAVEIYRMTDRVAAAGTYLMKKGRETRDPGFRERHTVSRHQLLFQRSRYYVTINNLTGGDKLGPDLLRFGTLVASRLPPDVPPAELKRLPAAMRVAGSERLFRGPVALQALFTLGDADILRQNGRITGVAADYKDASGTWTLVLVDYPNPAAARRALTHLQQNLDKYLKPVPSPRGRLAFKDYEDKFGTATVTGTRLEIRLHLEKP